MFGNGGSSVTASSIYKLKGNFKMQATRSNRFIVSASLSALVTLGAAGAVDAQQTADGSPPPPKHHKSKFAKVPVKQDSAKTMAAQLQALQDQVEILKRRLDVQSASDQQTKATADQASAQAASAKAQAATATAATQEIPVQVKTAVDAVKPKTDKLYYKGVTVTLGGFIAFESIYRTHAEGADVFSSFAAIPNPNGSVGHTNELRFSARQTRLSALVQGDIDPYTHLGGYTEFDFIGAAQTANSNESNSYTPRIRHLYGQMDWDNYGLHALAGQTWSLVTLNSKGITPRNEILPSTIDAQYVPGFTWTRQPQLRLTKDFDKTLWMAVSVENPQTTFYTGATALPATVKLTNTEPAGSGFNSANTLSINHIPDVVAKVAYEPTFADRILHVEAYGLYRSFYERLNGANDNSNGGGFGAGLTFQILPGLLDFQVSGLAGKGVGRYGSGQLTDVTVNQAGVIRPISEVLGLAGLTLHATPKLDFYAYVGEEKESAQPYNAVSATGVVAPYGYGNPLYSNTACTYEGAPGTCVGNSRVIEQATMGFWDKPYVGPYGRIQVGLQYSLSERKAFAGNGALNVAPVGIDSMVFASFRYYPY